MLRPCLCSGLRPSIVKSTAPGRRSLDMGICSSLWHKRSRAATNMHVLQVSDATGQRADEAFRDGVPKHYIISPVPEPLKSGRSVRLGKTTRMVEQAKPFATFSAATIVSEVRFAVTMWQPQNFCRCTQVRHTCLTGCFNNRLEPRVYVATRKSAVLVSGDGAPNSGR